LTGRFQGVSAFKGSEPWIGRFQGDTALRQRVSDLVKHLDDATLSTLLRMGGDRQARGRFSSGRASRLLPAPSST